MALDHVVVRTVVDKNHSGSQDWKYFALEMLKLHATVHPKCDKPECAALVKAIRTAADHGV